jgi:hypothetical protein
MARIQNTHGARPLSRLMAVLVGIVLAVAVATSIWLVVSFPLWWADAPRIGLPVGVSVEGADLPIGLGSELGQIEAETWRGELEIELSNAWSQWFYTVVLLGQILLAALILNRLRRVVAAFSRGEGLHQDTARNLRWAGGLMVLESIVSPAIGATVSWLALQYTSASGVPLGVDWSSEFSQHGFLAGWVLVILSEALRQGAELRDEQSLTV